MNKHEHTNYETYLKVNKTKNYDFPGKPCPGFCNGSVRSGTKDGPLLCTTCFSTMMMGKWLEDRARDREIVTVALTYYLRTKTPKNQHSKHDRETRDRIDELIAAIGSGGADMVIKWPYLDWNAERVTNSDSSSGLNTGAVELRTTPECIPLLEELYECFDALLGMHGKACFEEGQDLLKGLARGEIPQGFYKG